MKIRFYLALAFSVAIIRIAYAQSADTAFYSFVSAGTIAGGQKAWHSGENEYGFVFRFNDRGRGPDQKTVVTLNADGAVAKLSVSGVDYYKNKYQESMVTRGDSAIWTVNGVTKSALSNSKFYAGSKENQAAPAIDELLIKWLDRKPGNKGEILPSGSVRASQVASKTISYKGKAATLQLYAIYHDTIPAPEFVWLDNEKHFFAEVDPWFGTIKKGYEAWVDTLEALQTLQSTAFYKGEMKKYASDMPSRLLITHADIFQSETAQVKKDMTVEIADGKITAIYPSKKGNSTFAGKVIDAKGKFLMPGLWDMHSHYFVDDGVWYLGGGVTHIRDMGNSKVLLTYKKQISANQLMGPDISYMSGFIDQKGPFQGPTGSIVSTLPEAIAAIREYRRLGYQQIKLYSSIDTAWVRPMCTEAHKLGMRACGHIPAFMSAKQAIDDGYDEVTHMNFIFLNFMDRSIDTRTPLRLRAVADQGADLDLQSEQVKAFIIEMKTKHIAFDPTMNVFSGEIDAFKGDTLGSLKPIVAWMPESDRSSLAITAPFGSKEQEPRYRKAYSNMLAVLKMMFDNGILIVAGTDGGNAIALHHELEVYVKAGIPPAEALKIATYNAAKDCGMLSQAGQVKPGMSADLILIDGNPVKNISDIRRVEWVIKNKRQYYPKQLLAAQGWRYYY